MTKRVEIVVENGEIVATAIVDETAILYWIILYVVFGEEIGGKKGWKFWKIMANPWMLRRKALTTGWVKKGVNAVDLEL